MSKNDSNRLVSEAEYAIGLGRVFLPDAVIATKAAYASPSWETGDDRSLLHDVWSVRTADQTIVRTRDTPIIRMDANIDYGGSSLAGESTVHLNLTKKVLLCTALNVGVSRAAISALTAYRISLSFDWLVRWMLDQGIKNVSDLVKDDFDRYVVGLATGDLLSLVSISSRLERFTNAIKTGSATFPTITYANRQQVDWPRLAELMGVTRNSISNSPRFRKKLIGLVPEMAIDVTGDLIQSLSSMPSERGEASSRKFEELLLPWDYLARLTQMGLLDHDRLRFDPFRLKNLTVVAAQIGRERERMLTLHPEDFFALAVAAAKWVLDFADYVIMAVHGLQALGKLSSVYHQKGPREALRARLVSEAPAECPQIVPYWTRAWDEPSPGALTVTEAAKYLMVAAGIIVACLCARRRVEIMSLKPGCVEEMAAGVWSIESYIAKNLRDLERMPVPGIVARAVAVLERLSATSRAKTDRNWIFDVECRGGSYIPIEWSVELNAFAELMKVPVPKGRDGHALTFHQLRRGFAVFYYYGNRFSSLDALSHMLWQLDPGVTRIYVFEAMQGAIGRLREDLAARAKVRLLALTEEEKRQLEEDRKRLVDLESQAADWDDVRCEGFAHRMLETWLGDERPVGKGAARLYGALKSLTRGLAETVRIGSRSNSPDAEHTTFLQRTKEWARHEYLEAVPGVPVHCTCRQDHRPDLDIAECQKLKRLAMAELASADQSKAVPDHMPDTSYASTYVCLTCAHCAAFNNDRTAIEAGMDRLADAALRGPSEASRVESRARHMRLNNVFREAEAAVLGDVARKRP